ncbi:hypothetical protein SDJN02_00238, partial [Cucurbita argyrosperma subsp. argyrosperma]
MGCSVENGHGNWEAELCYYWMNNVCAALIQSKTTVTVMKRDHMQNPQCGEMKNHVHRPH